MRKQDRLKGRFAEAEHVGGLPCCPLPSTWTGTVASSWGTREVVATAITTGKQAPKMKVCVR